MFTEIGHYALALALALAFAQTFMGYANLRAKSTVCEVPTKIIYDHLIGPLAILVFFCVALAFVCLSAAFASSDFSVALVAQHSHGAKPLIYKLSGLWANHEGSMLLWVLVLSGFGAVIAYKTSTHLPRDLTTNALGIQGLLVLAFILFILLTSNPFARLDPPLLEGMDLNPLLEDPGLALHPPLLYMGYVGFSVVFAFACAALISPHMLTSQENCQAWARTVKRLTLISWICLTLGIIMGSYWAYYELGWGGWWFWDPVENASFMPWLSGTALLHSLSVVEKRNTLKMWTLFLALLTFSLSLIGTFLVRSGIVTSVHSFASDPGRGLFILAILGVFIGGSLLLFGLRIPALRQEARIFNPFSREGLLVFNNIFLTSACATVFMGTFYPLILELTTGQKISVGPPFFEKTCVPILAILLLVLPIGQSIRWKDGQFPPLGLKHLIFAAFAALLAGLIWNSRQDDLVTYAWSGLALGLFLIFTVVQSWKRRLEPLSLFTLSTRLKSVSFTFWGMTIAHTGVGLFVIGVTASLWRAETMATLKPLEFASIGAYTLRLDEVSLRHESTYRSDVAHFTIFYHGRPVAQAEASKRFYPIQGISTVETALVTFGFSQLYIAPGTFHADSLDLRLYWHPWILLIWLGGVTMALGGILAFCDRKYRRHISRPLTATAGIVLALLYTETSAYADAPQSPHDTWRFCTLSDPSLEARARALTAQLRCVVCQNQSLDDSDASLAQDLRCLIRERLAAGDDEPAIKHFLVTRYSEFILLEPVLGRHTLLLWGGPFFLLSIGIGLFLRHTFKVHKNISFDKHNLGR